MLISHAFLIPHRPTLLVDQHRGHRTEMLAALEQAAHVLAQDVPEVVVVLSARWLAPGPFRVDASRRHRTLIDYAGFGVEARYDCAGQPALARALVEAGQRARVHVAAGVRGVDSGVTVPLHFLLPGRSLPVVPLSLAARSRAECRAWGEVLRRVIEGWPERVAFLVGGALSNNEHAWNLRREVPEARTFDDAALGALRAGAWNTLVPRDRTLAERARPEAELRHLDVLRGFLGADVCGAVRCYESGPGIGAALVEFEVEGATPPATPPTAREAPLPWRAGVESPSPLSRPSRPAPVRRPLARRAAGSGAALPRRSARPRPAALRSATDRARARSRPAPSRSALPRSKSRPR